MEQHSIDLLRVSGMPLAFKQEGFLVRSCFMRETRNRFADKACS